MEHDRFRWRGQKVSQYRAFKVDRKYPGNYEGGCNLKEHAEKKGYGLQVGANGLPSTGIPFALVNGTIVVKDSKVQKVFPGQAIRYPEEDKGRFVPVAKESWLRKYTRLPDPSGHAVQKYE